MNSFLLHSPTTIRWKRPHCVCLLFLFHFCSTRGSRTPNRAEPSRVPTHQTSSPSPSLISLLSNSPTRPTALHHAPLRDGLIQDLVLLGRALWLDRVPAEMRLSFLGIPRLVSRMMGPSASATKVNQARLPTSREVVRITREGQTVCDIWHIC